jgi:hypothetical protein
MKFNLKYKKYSPYYVMEKCMTRVNFNKVENDIRLYYGSKIVIVKKKSYYCKWFS